MTDGWFRGRGRMHYCATRKKPHSGCSGCCGKAKCGLSKARRSSCVEKQFVSMATHPVQLSSRANCVHDLRTKALELKRRGVRCDGHERPWSRYADRPVRICFARKPGGSIIESRTCPRAWSG